MLIRFSGNNPWCIKEDSVHFHWDIFCVCVFLYNIHLSFLLIFCVLFLFSSRIPARKCFSSFNAYNLSSISLYPSFSFFIIFCSFPYSLFRLYSFLIYNWITFLSPPPFICQVYQCKISNLLERLKFITEIRTPKIHLYTSIANPTMTFTLRFSLLTQFIFYDKASVPPHLSL